MWTYSFFCGVHRSDLYTIFREVFGDIGQFIEMKVIVIEIHSKYHWDSTIVEIENESKHLYWDILFSNFLIALV